MLDGTLAFAGPYAAEMANARLRAAARDGQWIGLLAAALLHFLVLALWPRMEAADLSLRSEELISVDVPPQVEIPPPPEQIARPAVPVLSTDVDISEDITIGEVTFDENPVSDLPPPPTGQGVDVSAQPRFTPYEVKPELRDRTAFLRELTRRYPALLRDAGVGGTAVLWIFIDETGAVRNTRVTQSSGNEELDRIAQEVVRDAGRFSPALNRDQRVPVWIQMPVTFTVER